MKICSTCKERKPLHRFSRNVRSRDGFASKCMSCKAKYIRDLRALDPEKYSLSQHASKLKYSHQITAEQYKLMLDLQDGLCFICRKTGGPRRLAVDHDHACCPDKRSCGKCVRALLCTYCNTRLAWLEKHRDAVEKVLNRTAKKV